MVSGYEGINIGIPTAAAAIAAATVILDTKETAAGELRGANFWHTLHRQQYK